MSEKPPKLMWASSFCASGCGSPYKGAKKKWRMESPILPFQISSFWVTTRISAVPPTERSFLALLFLSHDDMKHAIRMTTSMLMYFFMVVIF